MNKYIVLSDIHGNLNALNAVLQNARGLYDYEGYIILGDNIDYGIHGDEVINTLSNLAKPIVVNIWGNHEKALFDMDLLLPCGNFCKWQLRLRQICMLIALRQKFIPCNHGTIKVV